MVFGLAPVSALRPATSMPRFRQERASVNDLTLHYARVPTGGKPMVMLHGIGMDWRVWQAISRRLSPDFDLYLVDLRGHGESDKPAHGYTLPHYAADVEDMIDALGLSGVTLVGSSLGGMVAATVEAPTDIVSHRVLVDPPLTGGPIRDEDMFRTILRLKHEDPHILADFLHAFNPKSGKHYLRVMSEMWHEAADGVIEDMLSRPDDYYAIQPEMRHNESPTLIMQADPDLGGVLSVKEAQRALQLLPRGKLVYVPGAGHAVHAYKPVDFARLIFDFVEGPLAEGTQPQRASRAPTQPGAES